GRPPTGAAPRTSLRRHRRAGGGREREEGGGHLRQRGRGALPPARARRRRRGVPGARGGGRDRRRHAARRGEPPAAGGRRADRLPRRFARGDPAPCGRSPAPAAPGRREHRGRSPGAYPAAARRARAPTRSRRTRSTRRTSAWTRWWSACGRSWRDGEVVVARRAEARVMREQSGEEVRVELGPRSYPVVVAAGVLAETGPRLAAAGFGGRCALVTSERVGALYREPVLDSLRAAGFAPAVVEIPDGEEHKNLAWLAVLYDRLLDAGLERCSPLVALGGGVVTDLAGFAAATLLRGLPSVLLPTTLLGQIDAAIGGKTGINHVLGKNLIGAFHQPRLVLADVDTLATLPRREVL